MRCGAAALITLLTGRRTDTALLILRQLRIDELVLDDMTVTMNRHDQYQGKRRDPHVLLRLQYLLLMSIAGPDLAGRQHVINVLVLLHVQDRSEEKQGREGHYKPEYADRATTRVKNWEKQDAVCTADDRVPQHPRQRQQQQRP